MDLFKEFKDTVSELFGRKHTGRWVEWIHESASGDCCEVCFSLDKCFFLDIKNKIPDNPLHPRCHCYLKPIEMPVSEYTVKAECSIEKFTEYAFSPKYDKLAVFQGMGYDIMDSEKLKAEFERQARAKYAAGEYKLHKLDKYGQRISILMTLPKLDNNGNKIGERNFYSGWLIEQNGKIKLATAFGGWVK